MNLFLLRPIVPWEPWYDKCFGVVVRAESRESARVFASVNSGEEGVRVWLDTTQTSCIFLGESATSGPAEVIIQDERAS